MAFLGFHHRNRRRGHPAQLQRFLQVFGGQVVHGHKVFVLVHLHRSTQLEPHRFLHRFAVSLAFGIFLCYTVFSRKARAFTALLGFEYRVSAFLLLFYLSGIIQHQQTAVGTAHFVNIEFVSLLCAAVFIYNNGLIDFDTVHHNRSHKGMSVVPPSFPVFHETNLFTVPDYVGNGRCSDLLHWAVSMLHGCLGSLAGQFHHTKSITLYFSANGFKESDDIFSIFFAGSTVLNFFSSDFSRRCHLFQPAKITVQLLFKGFLPLLQLEPHTASFRRALCLEGSGVFFCTAQVVHGLFGVGKVFVLQNSALVLGQALGLQGSPVVWVKGQHFLCPAHNAVQHLLHPVHHGADGSGPAAVLLGLPALELYPALEIGFIGEDAPPGIAHQLLGSFLIGQILLGIVGHLLPDHLVHGLKAAAPGQIQQGMVLQSLCSLAVQCVVPVVVLVQHRAERILCAVSKEDPGRLRVHIGPHPAVCLSHTVLQHVFQNRRGAGCRRVQLDHLAASVARVAQSPLVDGLTPARQALFRQSAAQLALGPPGLCRIPAVGVGDLQRVPALEVAQHIVHVGRHAAAGARQLQRLVKGLHVLHLAQPVQSGCCRRIAVTVHAFRLFPADLLRRLFAHLPAPQHLLRPGLLLALRPRCFHAVGLPHLAVAAVHPVKGAFFHRDRLHHSLPVSSILRSQTSVFRTVKG